MEQNTHSPKTPFEKVWDSLSDEDKAYYKSVLNKACEDITRTTSGITPPKNNPNIVDYSDYDPRFKNIKIGDEVDVIVMDGMCNFKSHYTETVMGVTSQLIFTDNVFPYRRYDGASVNSYPHSAITKIL